MTQDPDEYINELIERGDVKAIEDAIIADPSLVNIGKGYDQPIHVAAGENCADIVELLIRHGADVNSPDEDRRTPLHRAADSGPETVRVLLQNGADPNTFDKWGYTPWSWAIFGQTEPGELAGKLFRGHGARYGLMEAAAMGDVQSVRSILDQNPKGLADIPSHQALLGIAWTVGRRYGSPEDRLTIVKLLFEHGLTLSGDDLLRQLKSAETSERHDIATVLREFAN